MLTAETSLKHIYHLGHNCFLGDDRLHFLGLHIHNLTLCNSAYQRNVYVCVSASLCLRSKGRSAVSAGVNAALRPGDQGGYLLLGTLLSPSEHLTGNQRL